VGLLGEEVKKGPTHLKPENVVEGGNVGYNKNRGGKKRAEIKLAARFQRKKEKFQHREVPGNGE